MLGSKSEILLVGIVLISFIGANAFAEDNGIVLETDQQEYKVGDLMIISGFVEEKKMPVVAIQIFDPDGSILSANQVDIDDDNTFYKTVSLDSPFYDKEGNYLITLNYGQLESEVYFEMASSTEESTSEDDFSFLFPEILAMFTDKEIYEDGDTVTILGLVSEKDAPAVLIGIYDPFGTPAGFYFADVDNELEFTTSFLVKAGVNFKTEGFYSISAFYGDSEVVTSFEYVEQIEKTETSVIEEKSEKNKEQIIVEDPEIIAKIPEEIVKEPKQKEKVSSENKKTQTPSKNLSVEDIELGIMLNQINLNCDNSEFVDTISYFDSMGPALIRLCKYDEAIFYYDQSLIDEPNNVEILTNKGSALSKMGFFEEAIIHFDSALAIQPNYYLALNNKGNALSNLGKFEAAIQSYNKALLTVPDNPVVLKNLEKAKENQINFKVAKTETTTEVEIEQDTNLIKSTKTQQSSSIFDEIGKIFSSFFSFIS